jgi:hypothetical protein
VRPALPTRLTSDFNQTGRREGATHVYMLNGSKPSPLSPPYSGPYVARRRGPKSFDIFIGGRLNYFCGSSQAAQGQRGPRAGGASGSLPEAGIGQILLQ